MKFRDRLCKFITGQPRNAQSLPIAETLIFSHSQERAHDISDIQIRERIAQRILKDLLKKKQIVFREDGNRVIGTIQVVKMIKED